jgi:hypothetical protein
MSRHTNKDRVLDAVRENPMGLTAVDVGLLVKIPPKSAMHYLRMHAADGRVRRVMGERTVYYPGA